MNLPEIFEHEMRLIESHLAPDADVVTTWDAGVLAGRAMVVAKLSEAHEERALKAIALARKRAAGCLLNVLLG